MDFNRSQGNGDKYTLLPSLNISLNLNQNTNNSFFFPEEPQSTSHKNHPPKVKSSPENQTISHILVIP
jgi:hypothetical protein